MKQFLRLMLLSVGIAYFMSTPLQAGQMQQVNPGVARETAECFARAGQRVDCFARTFGNGLSAVFADSEIWNLPRNLGGNLASAPSCVSRGPGSINCFAATDSGVLATIALDGSVWSRWSSLGGSLGPSRVSCVTMGQRRISCHARGAGGQFLERNRNEGGAWDEWRSFGAVFSADPACLAISGGRDACFGRGPQGEFVALVPDDEPARRQEVRISGDVEGRPSCIADPGGTVSCVMMQASGGLAVWRGQIAELAVDGRLQHVDVRATGEPSCFTRGNGMACGWRNARSELSVAQIAPDGEVTDIPVQALGRITGVKCLSLAAGGSACIVTGTDKSLRYVGLSPSARMLPTRALPDKVPPAATPVETTRVADSLEGRWQLSDVSTGATCSVSLLPDQGVRPGAIHFEQGCRAIALPQGLSVWKRDLGSLRFSGGNMGHSLHFSPMEGGKWMSPNQSSAVILSRPQASRTSRLALDHRRPTLLRAQRQGKGRVHR